jgi:SHS2 domain-containing protein
MPGPEARPPFEILEHTADIGLAVRGSTLEQLFENAAWGIAEILGARANDQEGEAHPLAGPAVNARADDLEGLLVAWLDEVLFALERSGGCLSQVEALKVTQDEADGNLLVVPCSGQKEGTELKAATYHQLSVQPDQDGWTATVYFDV